MAGNNVIEILLQAKDQASANIKKVSDSSGKLQMNWKTMAAGATALVGAVAAVGAAMNKLSDDTMNYGLQVRDMVRLTGSSAEQMSALIQVADDARISQSELGVAMKFAVKQGINPSIDGMKTLADRYNAITDPVARGQFLMQNFGKAGLKMGEMMAMGSDGIQKSANAAKELGLVIDNFTMNQAQQAFEATDALGDSFEALKLAAGKSAMPAMTDLKNVAADTVKWWAKQIEVNTRANELYKTGAINMEQLAAAHRMANGTVEQQVAAMTQLNDIGAKWQQTNLTLNEQTRRHFSTMGEYQASLDVTSRTTGVAADETQSLATAVERLNGINITIGDKFVEQIQKIQFMEAGGGAVEEQARQLEEKYNAGLISVDQYKQGLADAYVAAEQVRVKSGEITTAQAAADIKANLNVSLQQAMDMAQNTAMYLDTLPASKTVDIVINTTYNVTRNFTNNTGPTIDQFGGSYKMKSAFGNTFKIPAAFGFEGFQTPMGTASGGERVTITPEGKNQEVNLSRKSIAAIALAVRDRRLVNV